VLRCLDLPPPADNPARLLNIGNHRSERVDTLVALLERELGRKAVIRTAPRPAADVDETFADVDRIAALTGFAPATPLAVGIARFATWFRDYYQLD
jgi:UDP-glucuronate 4-epimerase